MSRNVISWPYALPSIAVVAISIPLILRLSPGFPKHYPHYDILRLRNDHSDDDVEGSDEELKAQEKEAFWAEFGYNEEEYI